MSVALYRKYRPSKFEDLIGQNQSVVPLQRAIENNMVAHAYIFSGPRGCGKTTTARIFAKCLNCHKDNKPQKTPCGQCVSCIELANDKSDSIDVLEIDGASNNGVDSARELREKLSYAPVRDRYKIIILDEAHRMTASAFDALLKIVEEPPEHIKFIFATTDPSKLLATIRSRSYEYPFRLVQANILKPHLEKILESENITAEKGVLELAIKNGTGSVRDTLSVLDQLIASNTNNKISYNVALNLLGYASIGSITNAVKVIRNNDQNSLIKEILTQIENGIDFKLFLDELLEYFTKLIIAKFDNNTKFEDLSSEQIDTIVQIANSFEIDELNKITKIIFEYIANYDDSILTNNNAIVFSSIIIQQTTQTPINNNQNVETKNNEKVIKDIPQNQPKKESKSVSKKSEKSERKKSTAKFENNLLKGRIEQNKVILGFEDNFWRRVLDKIDNDDITLKTLLTNARQGELELSVIGNLEVDENFIAKTILEVAKKEPKIIIKRINLDEKKTNDKDFESIDLIKSELGGKIVKSE